ncbi:MAG: non-ribosomal peptide synthetase, partial [Nocardia sp.]|nr:non-ribosomal peptide synthetase [Nocardia sp.]
IRLGEITWTSGELASSVPPVTEFPARTMAAEFAAAAARHADEVAVVSDDARLTYRELDALSDAIAAWVHAAVPDRLVGVAMAPSIRFVATVLALFKSGKVYVPLDPSSPPARLAAMTAQCGATTALADRCDTLSIPGIRLLELPAEPEESAPAPTAPDVDDQAYLLFTSGTTGVPKGVPVTHRAATRFYDGLRRETGIGRARWLLFHSISFDVSLVEIFAALFAGGTVCVPAPEVKRDPRRLAEFVRRHRIEAVLLTPSAFAMLADRFTGIDSIRHLLIGGERLEYPLLTEFVTARGDVAVWNCYGITETTMYHTAFPVPPDPGRFPAESVIGRPFADMGMAVVDDRLRVLPRGVRGQLVVSGAGLMAGYLNRDELTAEKFVTIEGVRSYLTGDRGHLDAEGRFVISGRIDNQVKIRGHRCELGDIEAALYRTGLVANTHVALDGSGLTAELVCFVVPVGAATMPQLRERLREYLPRYLEPDIFVPLETLPLNTNGKVDDDELFRRYRADADTATAAGAGESAGTGVDDVVTQVWTEVLGTSDFEGTTRFFDAGGTSAMVLQVGERLRTRLGLAELDVVDLFEHCTPDTLSGFLADKV